MPIPVAIPVREEPFQQPAQPLQCREKAVPRKIHQIWFQGAQQIPPKYRDKVQRLKAMNPEWEHLVWDDATLRQECAQVGPEARATYDAFEIMHQKIDFGRYCVLLRHGGISVDMDVDTLKSFSSLPFLHAIDRMAVTRLPLSWLEGRVSTSGTSSRLLNNATIICPPNDPALQMMIEAIMSQPVYSASSRALMPKAFQVMATTGPNAFSQILRSIPRHLYIVLKPNFFEPCLGQDPYCLPKKETVLYHRHDSSWHSFSPLITVHMYLRPFYMPAIVGILTSYVLHVL